MDILKQTLDLCKMYQIKPERSKGQNFLIDEDVYDAIIDTANLKKSDVVLEVGPGLGFLTFKMAERVQKVLAVEVDSQLAELLKTSAILHKKDNVKIFNNDILKLRGEKIDKLGRYKIVTNLPYNITSVFLRKFLSVANKPEEMTLLLQKEIVDRITSEPPQMSLLSLSVQFYATAKKIAEVPRSCFFPAPKVDSAIIKIVTRKEKLLNDYQDEKRFFKFLRVGFSSKRKMLKNNLSPLLKIEPSEIANIFLSQGIKKDCRAEDLSLPHWLKLFSVFKV